MYISIRGRVLINVEALNMTESVGNYVKHRRVPVILAKEGYTTFFVPAISGESIAHGFQEVLAKLALNEKIPICNLCTKGIFLKSTNEEVLKSAFNISKPPANEHDIEKLIVTNCIVEDIGGFLYAPKGGGQVKRTQVKRTSQFSTGYMIPVKESLENAIIEPQLHSRYALGTKFIKKGASGQAGQMIYYVEMASSVYTFSFDLDTTYIGKATYSIDHAGEALLQQDEITKRKKVALEAIRTFLAEMLFGAKKTRFLPVVEWESIVIAISDDIWTVPSPNSSRYIIEAISKAKKHPGKNLRLFVYINPDMIEGSSGYIKRKTEELVETMKEIIEEWKNNITQQMPEYANKIDWEKIVKDKLEKLISKRLEEVAESKDLTYITNVQKNYMDAIEQAKGENYIKIYNDFIECVNDAINEGLNRL